MGRTAGSVLGTMRESIGCTTSAEPMGRSRSTICRNAARSNSHTFGMTSARSMRPGYTSTGTPITDPRMQTITAASGALEITCLAVKQQVKSGDLVKAQKSAIAAQTVLEQDQPSLSAISTVGRGLSSTLSGRDRYSNLRLSAL